MMNQALVDHWTIEASFQSVRIRRDLYKNELESCSSPLQKWDTQTTFDGARLPWAPVWRVTDTPVVRSFACLLVCCLMFVPVDDKGRKERKKNKALYHPAWHVLGNKLRQQVRRAGLGFVLFVARLLHPKSLTSVGIAYRSVGLAGLFWDWQADVTSC